ncbi:hypothetical protein HPB48_021358 [Haemaphysalis longicornis]|uniref:Uncharacterized protein n=1 Tax=Haemaphysalis longicornis TaxID=44386 RepID=A0A9J6FVN9_HAELO|nr:hypothetical protein HPB48_021358 [Haemaphysalis longicornis]
MRRRVSSAVFVWSSKITIYLLFSGSKATYYDARRIISHVLIDIAAILAVVAIAVAIGCCRLCKRDTCTRKKREPLLPASQHPEPPRERQSTSRPASTQTRNPSPAETTNVTQAPGTYAIVYPPSYPSGGVRGGAAHPGVPQGAAVFHSWSPALAPHPEEEDHGYQSQRLQAYYVGGMPGYSAVGDAVPMNRPRRSSQEAMPSIPRSPPPPYPYQGYQH